MFFLISWGELFLTEIGQNESSTEDILPISNTESDGP